MEVDEGKIRRMLRDWKSELSGLTDKKEVIKSASRIALKYPTALDQVLMALAEHINQVGHFRALVSLFFFFLLFFFFFFFSFLLLLARLHKSCVLTHYLQVPVKGRLVYLYLFDNICQTAKHRDIPFDAATELAPASKPSLCK